ncbi:MAG: tetratricopeptide repeat protein, partial [Thermoplasmata archaeon]
IEIAEKIGSQSVLPEAYCEVAEVHFERRDLEEALEISNRALSLSSDLGQKRDIARSRRIVGMVYRERHTWNMSIENFEQSIRIFKEIGWEKDLGESYYEFGLMWKQKGDIAMAKEHHRKAAELFEKLDIPRRAARVREALDALDTGVD